ncbi:hypothetical protein Tco_0193844 [Tanacetum coccineum]
MDSEYSHMVVASKVPMLKPSEFEIWRMWIEQYIQMIDYALWDVIKNGNSAPKTIVVEGVEKFNSIKDAKSLLEAIEKRFGGNAATKKTQINLLKQQYENFSAPRSETLDQTFDRLQKLVSQLEILGEKLSQKDVNQKLLRIYEPEVKGTSSSNTSAQNLAFVSSNNSGSTIIRSIQPVHASYTLLALSYIVNTPTTVDNLSDACYLAFFEVTKSQQLDNGTAKINPDDLEEIRT